MSVCLKCGSTLDRPDLDLDLLRLLASPEELSVRDISERRGGAYSTSKNQLSALYKALGVKSRIGAVLKGQALGLIDQP